MGKTGYAVLFLLLTLLLASSAKEKKHDERSRVNVVVGLVALIFATRSAFRLILVGQQFPRSLHKEAGYEHEVAHFGARPQIGEIAEYVYYADSDLCDQKAVDPHTGYPERRLEPDGKMEPWRVPFILIVDRGDCTFVSQVSNIVPGAERTLD